MNCFLKGITYLPARNTQFLSGMFHRPILTGIKCFGTTPFGHIRSLASNKCGSLLTFQSDSKGKTDRFYSSTLIVDVPPAKTGKAVSKDDRRDFMAVFPDIVRDLTEMHADIPDVEKWFSKVLQYNVSGGKKNRGLALVLSYRLLADPYLLTPENVRLTQILGWCVELLQSFFLVADDIMDSATTRRGRPCWYKSEDIGVQAFNDSILMEQAVYSLLRKYFSDKPYYVELVELFQKAALYTSLGQCLDLLSCPTNKKPDLDNFTMKRYESIVKYKTAYYSFYLPVASAMYMADVRKPELIRQAKTILLEMGEFFQVQDDFLDCFGDPAVTGKIGTDIEDGKCSWLVVVALQRANTEQRAVLDQCYGSKDPADIERVKDLYEELEIPKTYEKYEEDSNKMISTHIHQISRGLPHRLFFKFMEKIYRRRS